MIDDAGANDVRSLLDLTAAAELLRPRASAIALLMMGAFCAPIAEIHVQSE